MASGDPNSIQIPQPVAPANGNVPAPGTFTPQAAIAPVSTGEGVDVSSHGSFAPSKAAVHVNKSEVPSGEGVDVSSHGKFSPVEVTQQQQQAPQQPAGPTLQERIGAHIPDVAMPALSAINKYAVEPFEKMAAKGAQIGGNLAESIAANPGAPSARMIPTQQPALVPKEQFEQQHPVVAGVAKGVGGFVGGVVADPRNWPLMGGEAVGPVFKKLMSGGFGTMMGAGTLSGAKDLYNKWDTMSPQERSEAVTKLGLGAYFTKEAMESAGVPITETAKNVGAATIRGAGKGYNKVAENPELVGGIAGAGIAAAGHPLLGLETGLGVGMMGRGIRKLPHAPESVTAFGLSPEEATHQTLETRAAKSAKEAAKTQAAVDNYKASAAQGVEPPEDVVKANNKAQKAKEEDRFHADNAKEAAAQAKAARNAPKAVPEPATQQVAAQPQAPTMRIPGTPEAPVAPMNVKTPGQVQPETFPQIPTEKPMVTPGMKTLAGNQGTVGMRPMLTEGMPEAAPAEAPKAEAPAAPATMAKLGKPERGNLKTLKVGEGGKVTDTETPLDRQLREALKPGEAKAPAAEPKAPEVPEQKVRAGDRRQAAVPVAEERRIGERRNAAGIRVDEHGDPVMSPDVQGHWQGSAFGEKPAEDIGAKAREKNPEPTRAETKGEAAKPTLEKPVPATEPGLMKAGEEGREQPKSAAEYHPAVREQVTALPDEKLKQLAKAHGLNPDEYDFKVRDEGRHRTERDQLAEEVTKQMGDDEKINIGRNAEQLEHKAEMANKTKAERAASLFPRLRGPVDEYGNAAVSGGSSAVEEAPGFKEWFGKSKVTNEQGKPLQVYHGTRASELFHEYSTEGPPSNEEGEASTSGSGADPTAYMGAHFAKEPEVANKFAGGKEGWLRSRYTGGEEKPRVNPVYLNLENPKDFGHESNLRDYIYQGKGSGYAADELLNSAMQADGIENPYDGGEEVDKWLDKYDSDPKFRAEQNQWLLEQFRSGGEGDDDLLRDFSQDLAQQAQAKLKGKGYDGAVYKNQVEGGTGYIAFDPKQIKSSLSAQFEKPDVITEKATNKLGNAAVAGGAPDSTGHSYAYTKSGDLHQVMARDSEGKTVAMVTATPEENAPRTWTVRHSASAEVGKGTGEKAYLRLVDAAQKEATRSGKPITLQGDTEMSTSAKRTWQKLETDRGLPVKWKASRPSIHFSPEEEEEVGADVTEEAPDFSKFRTQTMDKPGKKSPLKKM